MPTIAFTPVPAVSPNCIIRPMLLVTMEGHGSGRLEVTVASTSPVGVPDNSLHAIRFVTLTNARVDIGNGAVSEDGTAVVVAGGTDELHCYMGRVAHGQAFTATVGITDDCGEWQTFVGGGTGQP